jgi:asparagine synthase (glutamine-hydrolysing)
MCGIAGIYGRHRKVALSDLKSMSHILEHRGPDGEGFWLNEPDNIGFMHRRLSIIDLSDSGQQPMHYENGRYTITFNGEIYNYIELKEDLVKKGYKFNSTSDTEVLLAIYSEMQEKCLEYLDGMFAFAIWDNTKKELFIARDRFGEKPLYYCIYEGSFYFASEMKALFGIGVPRLFSETNIYGYLSCGQLLNDRDPGATFYQNIRQLDAANFMVISGGQIRHSERYWDLESVAVSETITLDEARDKFLELFTQSVKLRLRSDVPVGSSLSGGMDSSAIVLLANGFRRPGQSQNTFSARFKNFSRDEGEFMQMVIDKADEISPHYVWPDPNELIGEIDKLAYHQEEPFASGSIYAQFCVMRLAQQNNTTVLLDGQGADEQLGGYLYYYSHHLTHLITHKPLAFIKERKAYQNIHRQTAPYRIPRRLPWWLLSSRFSSEEYKYSRDVRSVLKRDVTATGLKTLLRYADRNSMAFSREVRLPFLSHKLVEFVFSLPVEFILCEGWTKYILRRSMEGIVPDPILWRKEKVGYEPPQDTWMNVLQPAIDEFKGKNDYLQFTGGKRVDGMDNWKWLMLKAFIK